MPTQKEAPLHALLNLTPEDLDIMEIALVFTARKTSMPALKAACEHVLAGINEQLKQKIRNYEGQALAIL